MQPQILAAAGAVLFRFRQIVHDPLPHQMPCQRLPPAPFLGLRFFGFGSAPASPSTSSSPCSAVGFGFRIAGLPERLEQRQLLFRELLALAVALRFQQFAQQAPILVLFRGLVLQLLAQIHNDLAQRLGILRQSVGIDGAPVLSAYPQTGPFPSKNKSTLKCFIRPRAGTASAVSPCSDRCRSAALLIPAP